MAQSARLGDINLGEINLGGGITLSSPDYTVTLTDSYTLSDFFELDFSFKYNIELEDLFLLVDEDPTIEGLGFSAIELEDAIAFLDSLSLIEIPNLTIVLTDSFTLVDAIVTNVFISLVVSLSDTLALSDAISVAASVATQYTQSFSDSLSFSDAIEIFSLQSTKIQLTDLLVLVDRIEVLGPMIPTSMFEDQINFNDEISVVLGIVGTPIEISLDDAISLSDSIQTRGTEGIDDYYRRYLDDRVIAGGDILLWFSDTLELTDDIQLLNS